MKIIKSLEVSRLLIKGISKTIKIKPKVQKTGFPLISLEALPASILGNTLTRIEVIKACEGVRRAGQSFSYQIIFLANF